MIYNTRLCIYNTLAINVCFNETSLQVIEKEKSAIFSVILTNPSSNDIMIKLVTADGTAAGNLNINYMHTNVHNIMLVIVPVNGYLIILVVFKAINIIMDM